MAQLGSASVLGTGGRRFESCHPDMTLLVQLVERRSPKPDVGGSSPPGRAELVCYTGVGYFGYQLTVPLVKPRVCQQLEGAKLCLSRFLVSEVHARPKAKNFCYIGLSD